MSVSSAPYAAMLQEPSVREGKEDRDLRPRFFMDVDVDRLAYRLEPRLDRNVDRAVVDAVRCTRLTLIGGIAALCRDRGVEGVVLDFARSLRERVRRGPARVGRLLSRLMISIRVVHAEVNDGIRRRLRHHGLLASGAEQSLSARW